MGGGLTASEVSELLKRAKETFDGDGLKLHELKIYPGGQWSDFGSALNRGSGWIRLPQTRLQF